MQHLFTRPAVFTPSKSALLAGFGAFPIRPVLRKIPTRGMRGLGGLGADYNSIGMYTLPYATAWPDLAPQLARIYTDKASGIPWLPAGWLNQVLAVNGANGNVLVPLPVAGANTVPFVQSADQKVWWNDFAAQVQAAVGQFAAQKQQDGQAALDALYANSDFWNTGFGATMIDIQQNIREGFDSATDVLKSPMKYVYIAGGLLLLVAVAGAKLRR